MGSYEDKNCTKTSTRNMRAMKHTIQEIRFELNMNIVAKQAQFLASQAKN